MKTTNHQRRGVQRARQTSMEPKRPATGAGRTPQQILQALRPGQARPMQVLDLLIAQFNFQHTARLKSVSHKTRYERARFLRQFFHELRTKAGFPTVPDPRNLGQRHVHAMVQVWRQEKLAPATIQTYLSFLRGLAHWLGKPGFVRGPEHYGLAIHEYERHEIASRDRSWSAQGVDAPAVFAQVAQYDARIAISLRLMHAFGLRRKESVMLRPLLHVRPFEETGLDVHNSDARDYVWIKGKGGRVRWLPVETEEQIAVIADAQRLASSRDDHVGDPAKDLRRNLRRLDYVLEKFGITRRATGVTGHGLRHQHLNDVYGRLSGHPSPVRGGGQVDPRIDREARTEVADRAGHSRPRASGAYLGTSHPKQRQST